MEIKFTVENNETHFTAEQMKEVSSSVKWGEITGNIVDQTDLAEVFVAYSEEIDKKVENTGTGVNSALYQLDFNSEDVTDETQIVLSEITDTKNVFKRKKLIKVFEYLKSKFTSVFVSFTETQTLTPEQRQRARSNIKAATGGQRRVTQDISKIIDLTPYTSSTNHFVCPCDGYLRLRGATSGRANASVDNYTSISALNDAYNMTFVSEGAWIFVSGNPQTAQFLPIEIIDG